MKTSLIVKIYVLFLTEYSDIVRRLRPGSIEAGNITYIDGSILGKHNGIIDYTIGQRRGLGIGGVSGLDETDHM